MNSIMRTVGGAFGGQIAATVMTTSGFTPPLGITAAAAALALAPTLLLGGASARRARLALANA